jgi:ParB-like nuclease domain
MRPISTEGFEKPKAISAGAVPMLQWLKIADLVVDPAYQRPIVGKGRQNVDRIVRSFSWSCFAPVVVSPIEGGKFAIIDGQHRTTSAAILGFESVPCQVVIAAREEQAAAFKAINGTTTPISQMALHAAALVARESWAVQIAHVCACAEVELLRALRASIDLGPNFFNSRRSSSPRYTDRILLAFRSDTSAPTVCLRPL